MTKGGDDSTTTKLDSCSLVNKDNLVVPNEDILTNISDENRDNFPCSASSGSSCHSSRCCCSSYVCSMCSPRGSLDHGIFPPDSGSSIGVNSVDITSPRIHSKSVLLQDHVEASTAVDNVQTITNLEQIGEQSHKITQTELLHYSARPKGFFSFRPKPKLAEKAIFLFGRNRIRNRKKLSVSAETENRTEIGVLC